MEINPSFPSLGLQVNGQRTGGRRGLSRLGAGTVRTQKCRGASNELHLPTQSCLPTAQHSRAGPGHHFQVSPMKIKISKKSLPNYGCETYQNHYNLDTLKVYNPKLWRGSNKIKWSASKACRTALSTQSALPQSVWSSPRSHLSCPLGPDLSSSGASGEHPHMLSLFFHLPCTLSTSTFYFPLPGIS